MNLKNGIFALFASTAILGLSSCVSLPGVDPECTPSFNPNVPSACPSSIEQSLATPMSALALSNSFDASKFKADMTGSTVGLPLTGLYSVTLNNQSGQPISQGSFSWSRQGNIISIDNPVAVKNWMGSVSGMVKSVKTNFVTLPVTTQPGVNAYMITIKYDQAIIGTAGKVWMESCNEAFCAVQ
ncbi:MAG: hypothetical protein JKX99_02865 [Robiginitomaculum sp.]|nr:hypothetical protein [Robiginitomaculum sp.]